MGQTFWQVSRRVAGRDGVRTAIITFLVLFFVRWYYDHAVPGRQTIYIYAVGCIIVGCVVAASVGWGEWQRQKKERTKEPPGSGVV